MKLRRKGLRKLLDFYLEIIYIFIIKNEVFEMASKQFVSIRYPFTSKDIEGYFVDLDSDNQKAMRSDIMHLIFTPTNQRIRHPEFGTDLIKFIFNPNDDQSWSDVKSEIQEKIRQFIPAVNLTNIEVYDDPQKGLTAKIQYTVDKGKYVSEETITTPL